MNQKRARDRAAEAAVSTAAGAIAKMGILDRLVGFLGIETHAIRVARQAQEQADRTEQARDDGDALRRDLAGCTRTAARIARDREAERERWHQRPNVVRAQREQHGNELIRRAIGAGDKAIQRLAALDFGAARQKMLRRELEAKARHQAEQQREQEMVGRTPPTEGPLYPSGPCMR